MSRLALITAAALTALMTGLAHAEIGPPAPLPKDCYKEPLPINVPAQTGGAELGGGSPIGTNYNLTPAESPNGPANGCFPIFNPGLPGAPDDVVTFDGIPEQIRTLVNGAVPQVVEQEMVIGPNETHLTIQLSTPPGTQLFPGGQFGPGMVPLTDACVLLGNALPLNFNGPKVVTNATIVFRQNATPVAGPFDVTSMFSTPWNGTFAMELPGAAGSPINVVLLDIFILFPECFEDEDCDDGNPCTIDECINFVCVNTPVADPCCGINCDDGNPCTTDTCADGLCINEPIVCNDFDCCTIDECVAGACVYTHVKNAIPTQHAARRAFHKAHAPCLALGGGSCNGGGGGPPITVPALDDAWTTHDGCDTGTSWRIGLDAGDPPIPAGFFDPGSEPFTGTITFQGVPLGDPNFGNADTIVRRSSDPFDRDDLPGPDEVTVELELVQLQLVSCEPITVIIDGQPTQWDVTATISDCSPPAGTLTAVKSNCNGGTYSYALNVQQKATFTKVGDPGTIRVFDTGCLPSPFDYDALEWPDPTPWFHDIDPNLPLALNRSSTFHTGVPAVSASTVCGDFDLDNDNDVDDFKAFLQSYGHVAFEPEYLPYTDYDGDADTDEDDYREWLKCRRCHVADPTAKPPVPLPLGDLTVDGSVIGDDLAGFVDCLLLGNPPAGVCTRADIDQNGMVNERDIAGMVLILMEVN
ncbi:hypothetical protein RAS2_10780 [Phycisphaerae bacterium RAS2]|nr:hypothetical protein RAS2_10780 [Phycisphaerae bacterium RAS2]